MTVLGSHASHESVHPLRLPVGDDGQVELLPAYGYRWPRVVRPGDRRLT